MDIILIVLLLLLLLLPFLLCVPSISAWLRWDYACAEPLAARADGHHPLFCSSSSSCFCERSPDWQGGRVFMMSARGTHCSNIVTALSTMLFSSMILLVCFAGQLPSRRSRSRHGHVTTVTGHRHPPAGFRILIVPRCIIRCDNYLPSAFLFSTTSFSGIYSILLRSVRGSWITFV